MASLVYILLLFLTALVTSSSAGIFKYRFLKNAKDGDDEGLHEKLEKCEEMKTSLKTFYNDYILQQVGVEDKELMNRRIKAITGIDFTSNRQITRLSCKLIGVKNLQQLARILNLPLELVVKYYNLFKKMIEENGGTEGMARLVDLWEVTVPAAKEIGFPYFPLNCSYELAYDFFAHVVHDFGKDFIMDFLRPYATENLELNNIDAFVKALLEATSMSDFAKRVGLDPNIVRFFEEDLEIYTSDQYPFEKTITQARAEVILARTLEKLGLLDLKLRSRPRKYRKPKPKPKPQNSYYYPDYRYLNKDRYRNNYQTSYYDQYDSLKHNSNPYIEAGNPGKWAKPTPDVYRDYGQKFTGYNDNYPERKYKDDNYNQLSEDPHQYYYNKAKSNQLKYSNGQRMPSPSTDYYGSKQKSPRYDLANQRYNSNSAANQRYNTGSSTNQRYNQDTPTHQRYNTGSITDQRYNTGSMSNQKYNPGSSTNQRYNAGSSTNQRYNTGSSTNQRYNTGSSTNQRYNAGSSTNQRYNAGSLTNQRYNAGSSTNQRYNQEIATNQRYNTDSTKNQRYNTNGASNERYNVYSAANQRYDSDNAKTPSYDKENAKNQRYSAGPESADPLDTSRQLELEDKLNYATHKLKNKNDELTQKEETKENQEKLNKHIPKYISYHWNKDNKNKNKDDKIQFYG